MNGLLNAMFRGMEDDARKWGSDIASHMPLLALLAERFSFGKVVELGVGRGWSTVSLLAGAYRVISYDVLEEAKALALKSMDMPEACSELQGWEFRVKSSLEAHKDFDDKSVSLWFRDTSQSFDETLNELSLWLPKIDDEGVMCGNCYLTHERLSERKDTDGVKRAVDAFYALNKDRFRLQIFPGDMGLFVLWPRDLTLKKTGEPW